MQRTVEGAAGISICFGSLAAGSPHAPRDRGRQLRAHRARALHRRTGYRRAHLAGPPGTGGSQADRHLPLAAGFPGGPGAGGRTGASHAHGGRVHATASGRYAHGVPPQLRPPARWFARVAGAWPRRARRAVRDLGQAIAWLRAEPAQSPGAASGNDLHRALRVAAESTGSAPLLPEQFAAIGELVHDLLATGMDETKVRQVAGRVSAAMRLPRG